MKTLIGTYGTAIAGAAIILFFVLFAPRFASGPNLVNVLKDTSFLAIMALGFTLALIVSELDLSIAEVSSLSAVVCGALVHQGYAPGLAVAIALRGRDRERGRRCCFLAYNGSALAPCP